VTRIGYAFVLDATKPGETNRRLELEAYVSGTARNEGAAKLFAGSLRNPALKLVCVRRSSPWLAETLAALQSAGYARADADLSYESWARN